MSGPVTAAEIRAEVKLTQQGRVVQQNSLIGVALFPLEGQSVPSHMNNNDYVIEISHMHLSPNYLLVHPGDTVVFVNRTDHFYKLFSPSGSQPLEVDLEPIWNKNRFSLRLDAEDVYHFFGRIHVRTYGRVDVVDTPYTRMVDSGELFEFTKLQAGRWLMRISSPGAETKEIEVTAMTSPPLTEVSLESLTMANLAVEGMHEQVVIEQLFPPEPGY